MGDGVDEPVDEFNLFYRNDLKTDLGWEIADEFGLQAMDYFGMRVYRNSDYWGTGAYLTARDGRGVTRSATTMPRSTRLSCSWRRCFVREGPSGSGRGCLRRIFPVAVPRGAA